MHSAILLCLLSVTSLSRRFGVISLWWQHSRLMPCAQVVSNCIKRVNLMQWILGMVNNVTAFWFSFYTSWTSLVTSTCSFFLCTSKWLFYMCLKINIKHHQSEKYSVPYCLNLFQTTLDTYVCTLASWFCCGSVLVALSKMWWLILSRFPISEET